MISLNKLKYKKLQKFFTFIYAITINLIITLPSNAEDLMEIYLLSKKNDPTFIIGQQQHLINLEKLNLVKSKLLPNINFTANQTHVNNKDKLNTFNNGNKNSINYETSNYSLNIDQPIFNLAIISMYYTGKKEILASLKKHEDLEQELLSKVIEQYFAILSAINQVEITKAAIETFSQQLDKATQKCNVGLATINDVNAAKAKLDNAKAQKITDVNYLNTEKEKLSQFVGKFIHTVDYLKQEIPLPYPEPNDPELWLNKARENNLQLKAARYLLEAADENAIAAKLENWPTINLVANISRTKTQPPVTNIYYPKQIGVNLNLPIFSGGSTISNSNAVALQKNVALQELEATYRNVESKTRIAYHTILTTIKQINAWEQSVKSNTIALESNQAAFEVGTKTITDVLNSQVDLLNAKKNYMQAKYEYLINTCRLKRATGSLSIDDLQQINNLLIITKHNINSKEEIIDKNTNPESDEKQ